MTNEHKKKLGAFYTPSNVTDTLSIWAVRSSDDIIVEPSFGGCNFLVSSLKVLESFGNKRPAQNIYGFDIDSNAFKFLKENNFNSTNFYHQDFLTDNALKASIADVILGNPPYLPIHRIDKQYKIMLFEEYGNLGFIIPKRSSLWVYFIVKALTYLKPGGRMAWVVPDSIAFTSYGKLLLRQLSTRFKSLQLIRINERYFSEAGTMEKTSFLLCEDYLNGSSEIVERQYDNLVDALQSVEKGNKPLTNINENICGEPLRQVINGFQCYTLGDLFKIRIGIVLGATKLLAFSKEEIQLTEYYPNYCYPIITKGKQLKNISIQIKDLLKEKNTPIYLIDALKLENEDSGLFSKFVSNFPESVLTNQTFSNRQKLFGYDDFSHPDAFLTFYSQGLPKLIINYNKELNCTNSVHRLYIKNEVVSPTTLKFIALQFFCDFLQIEVRSLGRQYGNAILKFEPSDAVKIPVLLPKELDKSLEVKIEEAYQSVSQKVVDEDIISAKSLAHSFLKEIIS